MNFTEGLNDFSREGMFYWCQTYMPIQLYSYFPSYPKEENPVGGVGYLTVFDSASEVVYITKRDFIPKPEYKADITYTNGKFFYKTLPIDLRSNYFFDCSWTLSYSPTDKGFVSWHDWHPDGVVQTENHFLVIKGNAVYKHNERTDSFCNFFGKDYPFEIEAVDSTGQTVVTSRNLEYFLEVYTYKNEGRNRFHVHHENFDHLLVHNSEQISPVLKLHLGNPNPEQNQDYPKRNATGFDITFFKEENKYRINQFWDSVKDRGEFTNAQLHLLATDASGYRSVVNPVALALDKPVEERKKFRHYATKFRLTKAVSGPYKFIFKFLNIKHQLSS